MLQVRPDQDEAAFPPFDCDETAPDAVIWLDDLDDEDADSPRNVRRRRPELQLKRTRSRRSSARLSAKTVQLTAPFV